MKLISNLKWLHRWLGLFLCLTIMSISLTGGLLVWKKEYLWLTINDARQTPITDTQATAQTIEKITAFYTDQRVLLIQLHSEGLALHKVFLDEGVRAWHNQQGEQLSQWRDNERFEDWLLDLHHRFLLGDIGLNIAGFSGLLLMPLLLIGLIIWWPRRKLLSKGLFLSKLKGVRKAELIRSHGNLGFIAFLPILLISLTGVMLTYYSESRALLLEPFTQDEDYLLSEGPVDDIHGADEASWSRVLERSLQQYPQASIRWVSPESYFSSYREVGLQQSEGWNRSGKTTVYIDSESGHMDVNINDLKRPKVERVYDFSYPLHTAKFGLWYRVLLCLVGLILFTMALFGLISFFKKI